mmetsp:Transcript_59757/g.134970  ORF Transcript_59757/g.134970 Transcript_59757/m.134970 type:complete len:90 (-) Transcript_59757:382-651(-)
MSQQPPKKRAGSLRYVKKQALDLLRCHILYFPQDAFLSVALTTASLSVKRCLTGKEFIKHYAKTPNVTLFGVGGILAVTGKHYLRRQVA